MYERFARWYDRLTGNVDYAARADYFEEIIARHRRGEGKLLLDLACGTGTLSLLLAQRGWDVIGVDGSGDMLAQAQAKAAFGGNEAEMQVVELSLPVSATVVDIMTAAGVASSKSEARRLIDGGGVRLGAVKAGAPSDTPESLGAGKSFVLHKGKKVHVRIELK